MKRLDAEAAIREANADDGVHGVLVYYPVFGTEQDALPPRSGRTRERRRGAPLVLGAVPLREPALPRRRATKKAILPCTPLAILKLLDAAGASASARRRPLAGVRAVVFNRSEVVGRPLASMMANDGAEVVSFDIDGAAALRARATRRGAHGGGDGDRPATALARRTW